MSAAALRTGLVAREDGAESELEPRCCWSFRGSFDVQVAMRVCISKGIF